MPKPEPFAATLARLRQRANLTRYALARRAGLAPSHYTRLEQGEQLPRLDVLLRLSRALGVSLGTFDDCG